jgi:hypothetical protein
VSQKLKFFKGIVKNRVFQLDIVILLGITPSLGRCVCFLGFIGYGHQSHPENKGKEKLVNDQKGIDQGLALHDSVLEKKNG